VTFLVITVLDVIHFIIRPSLNLNVLISISITQYNEKIKKLQQNVFQPAERRVKKYDFFLQG